MIYIKRFCFCIVMSLSIAFIVIVTLLMMVTYPIWVMIYYVITGNDPEDIVGFPVDIIDNFMDWYDERFGP